MATDITRPGKGRPREFDVDVVISRAMDLFWTKGYHSSSLPELLAATGLSRGSLYSAFGDKHALFLVALDRYITESLKRVDDELKPERGALAGITLFLDGYLLRTTGAAGRRGCLVVATAMDLAGQNTEVEKRVRHFFKSIETRLTQALRRAQQDGEVVMTINPGDAARLLLSMVEGMRVIAKTGIDMRVWEQTLKAQLALLAL